ncbi:hypothetical protein DH2020_018901 [Rehmannia glutinosa]|uniref:Extra-large guanine nucleotide-binding protein 3-like n=1 Tax=Rehmannia glutinosa TaxID=99300 RepID=A0ABR0WNS1_REHGL
MASPEAEEPEPNSWGELLRKMLPEGAPLLDEDQLDYSISFDYIGPSPFFKPPIINPMIPKTRFTTFPKQSLSLTPKNPAWFKSHSSSQTTYSDNKKLSVSSIAFEYVSDDNNSDGGVEPAGDHYDQDNCSISDEEKREIKRDACVLSSGNKIKGCSRCGKGSNLLLRGKEECIVCGAEYCKKCVLKAMGTMPEGRKCVGCIGKPIDEAKRGKLGKRAKLLTRLCSRLEIKQIMQVERDCKANQVGPEQVTVNGRELREDELDALLGCTLPPRDLKPGRYWYDKDSGLFGKEGEKPDRIISSKLDVGGKLQTDASSGNTRVYINGREITNVELRVLKASVRFICSLFSLPVPPQNAHRTKEKHASFSSRLFPEYLEQHRIHKVLLHGLEGSGSSTIFKQAKFMYSNKFTTEELQNIKLIIQSNMYRYLSILLEGRELFEEEFLIENESAGLAADRSVRGEMECDGSRQCIYSVNQKINNFSDWLLDIIATGDVDTFFPAAAREYAPVIDEIWNDPAIQESYNRRDELHFLPDVAKHFLDRGTPFLLLLTDYDLFGDKINRVPITVCEWFRDFDPLKTHSKNLSMVHQAFYYIAVKFKELYTSITGRKLYVRQVEGHDRRSVDEAFRYMREIIEWEEVKDGSIYAMSDEDLLSGAETVYFSL